MDELGAQYSSGSEHEEQPQAQGYQPMEDPADETDSPYGSPEQNQHAITTEGESDDEDEEAEEGGRISETGTYIPPQMPQPRMTRTMLMAQSLLGTAWRARAFLAQGERRPVPQQQLVGRPVQPVPVSDPEEVGEIGLPPDHDLVQAVNAATCPLNIRKLQNKAEAKYTETSGAPRILSPSTLLRRREAGLAGQGGLSGAQKRHIAAFAAPPAHAAQVEDSVSSRAYIGQFSKSGDMFLAGFRDDQRIKLYDVNDNWRLRKDVRCRNRSITDVCLSPDQRFLIYCTLAPTVYLVSIGDFYDRDAVESVANVTDIHDGLHLHVGTDGAEYDRRADFYGRDTFGTYSIRWSSDGRELVAGTGDAALFMYDLEQRKVVLRVVAHEDDINAVAFADDSSNIILTGSDDALVKVWDRRQVATQGRPAGVLPGHSHGITHIDPKGDGRHLISNSKDQSIKLWDLRAMASSHEAQPRTRRAHWNLDYRTMGDASRTRSEHDRSLQSYRGHSVVRTLIRAYFSPAASTGQRYIYAGSYDGSIYMWDTVTGQQTQQLQYHSEVVRDCNWHPTQPMLASTSFDGSVCRWEATPPDTKMSRPQTREDGRWRWW